jgi:hypothetical protein
MDGCSDRKRRRLYLVLWPALLWSEKKYDVFCAGVDVFTKCSFGLEVLLQSEPSGHRQLASYNLRTVFGDVLKHTQQI